MPQRAARLVGALILFDRYVGKGGTMSLEEQTTELHNRLRAIGLRLTEPRRAILRYLMTHDTHPTADQLYRALVAESSHLSIATVYNNLNMLVANGVIAELSYGDGASRYDYAEEPHDHIICAVCGKMVDFYSQGTNHIKQEAAQASGFQIETHRLELYGVCPDCQQQD